jgi:TM2 domain-containing membrane protein YozV
MGFHNSNDIENPDGAKKFCSNCGEQIDVRAEICPHCGVRVVMPPSVKNPAVAVILSFFVVGLGQVYNGKYKTAILMFVLAVISAMLWSIGIGVITSLIIWIWSMSDAWNVAKGTGGSTSGSVNAVVMVVGGFILLIFLSAVIGAFVFGMGDGIGGDTATTPTTVMWKDGAIVEPTIVSDPKTVPATDRDPITEKYGTVTIYKYGQTEEVQCGHLNVFSDENTIFITNDGVEGILVSGHHNKVSYPGTADPEIINKGTHNTFEIVGVGYTPVTTQTVEDAPSPTPTIVTTDPMKDKVIIHKSGQWETVRCKELVVVGDNNIISIENEDIEKILVTGNGNGIVYPYGTTPTVIDGGDYNTIRAEYW